MDFIIPFIVLICSIFIGRMVNERSYRFLTDEQKSQLIDLFSGYRLFGFLFIIVVLAGLFVFPYFNLLDSFQTMLMFAACFLLYFMGMGVFAFTRLRKQGFPVEFIRLYLLALAIRFAGIASFFVLVFFGGGLRS